MARLRARKPTWSPSRLQYERARLIDLSISIPTSAVYSTAFHSYITFCHNHNLDPAPSENIFSLYISYQSAFVNPRTVSSYLSGICHALEPDFPHVREVRRSSLVTRTLRGAMRSRGRAVDRVPAITTADIRAILSSKETGVSFDASLFRVLLLTGFFGLLRLGEITSPSNPHFFDPAKTVRRSSVAITSSTYEFFLPANKTDPFFEGNRIIIRSTTDDINPYPRFISYLSLRDTRFPFHTQLFLTSHGEVPTERWFLAKLHQHLPKAFGAQSLRAGGATWLASIGTDTTTIQALDRWSSDTWKRYIRKHPLILHFLH